MFVFIDEGIPMPDLTQRFTGHLMLFDHEQRVTLSAGARLWIVHVSPY